MPETSPSDPPTWLRRIAEETSTAPSDGPSSAGPTLQWQEPQIPGYRILGRLGQGGSSVVYRAVQEGVEREVALKVLAGEVEAEDRARFRAEAEALGRVHHPGVVQVHAWGEQKGLPYLVLEYVPGGTLSDRLRQGTLEPRAAARLLLALAEAVAAVHDAGVVHRDLKPGNILLRSRAGEAPGDAGEALAAGAKVADFGVARWAGRPRNVTMPGHAVGTPSYMAPEQAAGLGAGVGPAADVWALGVVLYECLAGRPPFLGASAVGTLLQVQTRDPAPLSVLAPGTPRDLETVCQKCLEKEPRRRYASARELADDLRQFLAGGPVRARRPGRLERVVRWGRRDPWRSALLASGLVLALGVSGAMGRLAWRRADVMGGAEEALTQAAVLRAEGHPGQAVEVVSAAEARLDGWAAPGLLHRLKAARESLSLGLALDDARRQLFSPDGPGRAAGAALYRQAFRQAGMDVATQAPADVAAGVRASALRRDLVRALDHWAWLAFYGDREAAARVLEVARLADDDPWRERFRAILLDRTRRAELPGLAAEPAAADQPPLTLHLLAVALDRFDHGAEALTALRRAQEAHPSDFWLNVLLARRLAADGDDDLSQAVACARAALALRPDDPTAAGLLSELLRRQKDPAGAERVARRALAARPADVNLKYHLAQALGDQNQFAEARKVWRDVLELTPPGSPLAAEAAREMAEAERAAGKP